jgi:AraC family transcriptional regulator
LPVKRALAELGDSAGHHSILWCDTGLVRVGSFAVHPSHPRFHDAGQEILTPELVFPRTAVRIHHAGRPAFVGDPTTVTYYNPGTRYSRTAVSEVGDRCDWFGIQPNLLLEIRRGIDPRTEEHPDRPFPFTHGPSDASTYGLQRLALRGARSGAIEHLRLDELVLSLVPRTLRLAYARDDAVGETLSAARARELAERVRAFLSERYAEATTLSEIARAVASSPYHLCRVFRRTTGQTIHRYRTELRLRHSLERVAEPRSDLATIALDLGFATHSHFTAAFRRLFGLTPSQFRSRARFRGVRAGQS